MKKLFLKTSAFLGVFKVLNTRDKFKIFIVCCLQCLLGLLDLFGVAVIGLLGALSLNGVQSRLPGNRVSAFLKIAGLYDNTFQFQATILGILVALVLIFRTFLSIYITRRVLFYLSRRSAVISSDLTKKLMGMPLTMIQEKSLFENLYALTTGVSNLTLGVIGSVVVVIADISLLAILGIGLFFVDPWMAMSTILFFSAVGFILYKNMHKKVEILGRKEAELNIASNEMITEIFSSYRETIVGNRQGYYAHAISQMRLNLSNILAEQSFMPNVSKYVIESSVILGALAITAFQFVTQDAAHAVATLAIFLAAGTRIAPAVLRVQQGALIIKRNLGTSGLTLKLMSQLSDLPTFQSTDRDIDIEHAGFFPEVILSNVSFRYPNADCEAISEISLCISPGQTCAIVGPSGAGKSTLVDLILGVMIPDNGTVSISGKSPQAAMLIWPGAIGYVPQEVFISNGTIQSNVGLGFSNGQIRESLVSEALSIAQLTDFVHSLPLGNGNKVGDRGATLSGGQRQRIGIARALYTKPKLLVLDEATSALDGETESVISQAINDLRGRVTMIQIAHRLSTVREADKVIYLENGKILSEGTFDQVRAEVPDFDRQASLMGL